jgi:signal transduction histidine kinase
MLLSLSLGLLLLLWFQGKISKKIWKPFYETLSKTKSFEVNEGRGLQLEKQEIYEFNELNAELGRMTEKISRDYKNLKEFTENASHEIQTPLALINSRIEELIQEKDFTRHQMAWIQDIHESTVRLSKLNQALLLLSKIDNGQFYDHESIHMGRLIENKLADFEEIFNLKGLKVEFSRTREFVVEINAVLADILVSNLINNAVKHNFEGGKIKIGVSTDQLVIQNTGEDPQTDPSGFFERFKKHNTGSGSLGLGLAIVKKICDLYGLNIHYTYAEGIHALYLVRIADL